MARRCRAQKLAVWLFILALPLSLSKNIVCMPFLLQAMDDFHVISVNIKYGEPHLTLRHDGRGKSDRDKNAQGYERISGSHQFDGLHRHLSHHEFHIESSSAQTIASNINFQTESRKFQKLAALSPSASSFYQLTPVSAKPLPKAHPEIKSDFTGIRTTVLLI